MATRPEVITKENFSRFSCLGRSKDAWTLNQLKEFAKELRLPVAGKKEEICQRIVDELGKTPQVKRYITPEVSSEIIPQPVAALPRRKQPLKKKSPAKEKTIVPEELIYKIPENQEEYIQIIKDLLEEGLEVAVFDPELNEYRTVQVVKVNKRPNAVNFNGRDINTGEVYAVPLIYVLLEQAEEPEVEEELPEPETDITSERQLPVSPRASPFASPRQTSPRSPEVSPPLSRRSAPISRSPASPKVSPPSSPKVSPPGSPRISVPLASPRKEPVSPRSPSVSPSASKQSSPKSRSPSPKKKVKTDEERAADKARAQANKEKLERSEIIPSKRHDN